MRSRTRGSEFARSLALGWRPFRRRGQAAMQSLPGGKAGRCSQGPVWQSRPFRHAGRGERPLVHASQGSAKHPLHLTAHLAFLAAAAGLTCSAASPLHQGPQVARTRFHVPPHATGAPAAAVCVAANPYRSAADVTQEAENIQQVGFAGRVGPHDVSYIPQPDVGVLKIASILQDEALDEHIVSKMTVVERAPYNRRARSTIRQTGCR
jgi:hypothetical protein